MGRLAPTLLLLLPVGILAASCGDRPGPEMRHGDVTGGEEAASCIVREPPAGGEETWVVREGDTLASISRRCYGNESLWREIVAANPGRVGPRDSIRPGTTLLIPRATR